MGLMRASAPFRGQCPCWKIGPRYFGKGTALLSFSQLKGVSDGDLCRLIWWAQQTPLGPLLIIVMRNINPERERGPTCHRLCYAALLNRS